MSLTREQVLGAVDLKTQEVPTPEWGEGASVFVRSFSAKGRDELEALFSASRESGERLSRGKIVAMFACDASGELLFSLQDAEALGAKSADALSRIVDAGLALNAMRETDVENLEKN